MTLPPQNQGWLRAEFEALRKKTLIEAQRVEAEQAEKARECHNARPRRVNYMDEIRDWFEALPPSLGNRRYSIDEICLRFPGLYQDRPAPRVIAAALRHLGWTQGRDWTNAGRNRRYWNPPRFAENGEVDVTKI